MSGVGQFGVSGFESERHWAALTHEEAAGVLARYRGGVVARLFQHGQRPFSATALVEMSDGEGLFLKRHDGRLRGREALEGEHAFMRHVAAGGMCVKPPLLMRDGGSVLVLEGWVYEVFPVLDGVDLYRDVQSWEPYFCVEHARSAGGMLGAFHEAAVGFDGPERAGVLLVSGFGAVTVYDLEEGLERWMKTQPGLVAALRGRDWRRDCEVLTPFHDALRPLLGTIVPCWGHGDWNPANLFWTGKGLAADVCGVFDFGMSDRSCAAYDLAVALERTAVAWLHPGREIDWGQVQAFLAGYQEVRPLGRDERDLVVAFLPLVHVEFALSEVAYYSGLVGDEVSADVAYFEYLLGHAKWFGSAAGQDFLAGVKALLT